MGFLDKITGGFGTIAEGICDGLKLPEAVGDIASGLTNFATGNWLGLIQDGLDLAPNVMEGLGSTFKSQPGPPPASSGGSGGASGGGGVGEGGSVGGGTAGADARSRFEMLQNGVKPEGMTDEEFDKFQLQKEMQEHTEMITLLTNLLKMQHEARMSIARNITA